MDDVASQEAQAALPAITADIDGGRFLYGDANWPAKGGAWGWLQNFAQGAQWIVREKQPRRMRVLITWEYEGEEAKHDANP